MILVISIVGAAAGDIVRDTLGLPPFVGIVGMMLLIALLVFFGTAVLSCGSPCGCDRANQPGCTGIWHYYLGHSAGLRTAGADLRTLAA